MDTVSKKPSFDKKQWRAKKYDHKLQVKQKTDLKRVILKSKLHRQLRRDQAASGQPSPSQPLFRERNIGNQPVNHDRPARLSRVQNAKLEFQKKQKEKQKLRAEKEKKKEEIAKALEAYKKKKQEKFRLLSNKTKKGQPVMKGRMQLLFEKVKNTVGMNN